MRKKRTKIFIWAAMTGFLAAVGIGAVLYTGSAMGERFSDDVASWKKLAGDTSEMAENTSAGVAASDFAETHADSPENRQVILSMGEEPGTVFISWSGNGGTEFLRYAADKYSLPVAQQIEAKKTKVFRSGIYRYRVRLSGLEEGKLYYYEIGDEAAFGSLGFFHASKEERQDVFAYLGDPQFDESLADYEDWGRLVWQMYETAPDIGFAIAGGDLVNIPTKESHWNGFLDNCGLFSMIPLMTIPGNHEGVQSNNIYRKLFAPLENGVEGGAFYFFDYGHCRFIMLDSSFLTKARKKAMGDALWSARAREVESWLRRTLEESHKTWNIVVTHHPVYGLHDIATVSPEVRERWRPILEEGGADLVLCGHQHVYMRTREIDGIVHVMGNSGSKRSKFYRGFNAPSYSESVYGAGANYQIIRAGRRELEIVSYSEKGSIIDAARIQKGFGSQLWEKLAR